MTMRLAARSLLAFLLLALPCAALAQQGVVVTDPVTGNKATVTSNALQVGLTGSSLPPATAPSSNDSGTVTVGGTYQTVFASGTRKGCLIQNPLTATEGLSVRQGGAAVWTLPIGGSFSCASPGGLVVTDLIEVTAATTGHAFTAVSQ